MPPLLQGETQVALYGLGNAREERLVRCFMTPGQVDWCDFSLCDHSLFKALGSGGCFPASKGAAHGFLPWLVASSLCALCTADSDHCI